jgi:hypothetical protein
MRPGVGWTVALVLVSGTALHGYVGTECRACREVDKGLDGSWRKVQDV